MAGGELIDGLVAAIQHFGSAPDSVSEIEAVERCVLDGDAGLLVLWAQRTNDKGLRRFGLLVAAEELDGYVAALGLERVVDDIRLMIVEPHPTHADEGARTWFRSFAGFAM